MSDLSSLPRGGKGFSPHRFKRKFKYLTEHSKVVSPLSDNQESIIGAVEKYQKFIRRGTFGKMQQKRAIRQIKSSGDVGIVKLRKVKKIIHKLGEGHVDEAPELEAKESAPEIVKPRVRLTRANQNEELSGPKLARARINRGSGLSEASSPKDYHSALTNQPLVSINQKKEFGRGAGLASPDKANVRNLSSPSNTLPGPTIPLSR